MPIQDPVVRGLALTSERLADAVVIVTAEADPRVVFANPAFVRLTGHPGEALLGRTLGALQPPGEFRAALGRSHRDIAATGAFLADTTIRHRDGRRVTVDWQAAPVAGGAERGSGGYLFCILRDVSAQREAEAALTRERDRLRAALAVLPPDRNGRATPGEQTVRRPARSTGSGSARDALTGLINRREFERRLENAVASARRNGRRQVLCYIDLDHFRLINERAGHVAGDSVLRQVASSLRAQFRQRDTLARLGGDEFALLLDNCGLDEAERIAQSILKSFAAARFAVAGNEPVRVVPSIGLVEVTAASGSAPQLVSRGDLACYTAKELGRGRSHVYRTDAASSSPAALLDPRAFRAALEENRFQLYYQPIVPLQKNSGLAVHYEFLLRMRAETGELVLPRTLIAAAERHGLMGAVDRWVIRTALRQLADPQGRFAKATVAINLSGNSLDDPGLADYVVAQFAELPIAPRAVCFEITETEAIRDLGHAAEVVGCLRQLGCSIALDDFGSGQNSFAYLKALPADYIKIDGSFVRRIVESPVDRAVVASIRETGRIMGLRTIAEYAHSDAIVESLRALGIDYAQGQAVGSPRPVATGGGGVPRNAKRVLAGSHGAPEAAGPEGSRRE